MGGRGGGGKAPIGGRDDMLGRPAGKNTVNNLEKPKLRKWNIFQWGIDHSHTILLYCTAL